MKRTTNKHPELRKSIAVFLVLLLAFGGILHVFANESVNGNDTTVTEEVYYDGPARVVTYEGNETLCKDNKINNPNGGDSNSISLGEGTYFNYSISNDGKFLDWSVTNTSSHEVVIGAVSVKGSNGGNHFYYDSPVNSDQNLHAIYAGNSGDYAQISHFSYCFELKRIEPKLIINKVVLDKDGEPIDFDKHGFPIEIALLEGSLIEETIWEGMPLEFKESDDDWLISDAMFQVSEDLADLPGFELVGIEVEYDCPETDLTHRPQAVMQEGAFYWSGECNVTVTITNQMREAIELEIVKLIVTGPKEDEEIVTDMGDEKFEVTLTEIPVVAETNGVEKDTFAGKYYPTTDTSDGKTILYAGWPCNLVQDYHVEETDMPDDKEFELLAYKIEFFDGEELLGEELYEDDDFTFNIFHDFVEDKVVPTLIRITVVNRYVPEPKLIIKKVIVDEDDEIIEEDTTEFTIDLDEVMVADDLSQTNDVHIFDLSCEGEYVLEEVDLPEGYSLIGYEFVRWQKISMDYPDNGTVPYFNGGYFSYDDFEDVEGEEDKTLELDWSILLPMCRDKQDVTITIYNRYVPGYELIIEKRLLNANNVVIGSSTVPFIVEVEESGEGGFSARYDGEGSLTVNESIFIPDLEMGTYMVEELLTEAQEDDYELLGYEVEGGEISNNAAVSFTEEDEPGTSKTVVIVNRMIEEGDDDDDDDDDEDEDDNGGTTTTTTTGVPAVTTTVVEPPTPLAAPEVVTLDEPVVPLAVPVLPQTGVANPITFYLSGLFLTMVGLITRKRR